MFSLLQLALNAFKSTVQGLIVQGLLDSLYSTSCLGPLRTEAAGSKIQKRSCFFIAIPSQQLCWYLFCSACSILSSLKGTYCCLVY